MESIESPAHRIGIFFQLGLPLFLLFWLRFFGLNLASGNLANPLAAIRP
jgi:hypothetical protein